MVINNSIFTALHIAFIWANGLYLKIDCAYGSYCPKIIDSLDQ